MPNLKRLYDVIGTTWPAAEVVQSGRVTIRKGLGGGSRVSAATAEGVLTDTALREAESAMRQWGQKPTFMLRMGDDALDAQLEKAGYAARDLTQIYMCHIDELTKKRPPHVSTFVCWPPLTVQREIWTTGNIGPERLAVMARTEGSKTTILGRIDDTPAGTLFVGIDRDVAMVHAVEVLPAYRRKGLAKYMMAAAAFWARDRGALYMSLLTTQANGAANPLYASLRMDVVGQYHYRQLPE